MTRLAQAMEALPDRFRPRMAGNLAAKIQFEFTGDDGGRWFMRIAEGTCEVGEGEIDGPDAAVRMSAADFVGINEGTVSAPEVFWSGRIDITGDIEAVLALPPVMDWR
jgi:predicted lipid carrier protein YhbT